VSAAGPDTLAAIVLAAGSGRRFGGDKLFVALGGRPVLTWSLAAMEQSADVSFVVLVLSEHLLEAGKRLVRTSGFTKVRTICAGGARRQDSVFNGLQAAACARWVLIHDGARPFVDPAMIRRGFAAACQFGAAIAAIPVKDTVKIVAPLGMIESTPQRSLLWAAQTPQIFQTQQLLEAYASQGGVEVTDDAALLERAGRPVGIFEGSYRNLKITTVEDLTIARALARAKRTPLGLRS
jgi:2-C-methyl-D-erythritol 4-phosphate cytidylyltransferase